MKQLIKYLKAVIYLNPQKGLIATLPLILTALSLVVPLLVTHTQKDDSTLQASSNTGKKVLAAATVQYTNLSVCVYRSGGGLINSGVTISGYSTVYTGGGCNKYTFVSGKTLTITAAASGYYSQSRSTTLTPGTNSQVFYLSPIYVAPTPTPIQYSTVHACITTNAGSAIPYATVQLSGYSSTGTGSGGCYDYSIRRYVTANITGSASGYYSDSGSVYVDSSYKSLTITLNRIPPAATPTPAPKPKSISGHVSIVSGTTILGPYTGAKITLKNTSTGGTSTTTTDTGGRYSFTGLLNGSQTYTTSLATPTNYSIVSSQAVTKTLANGDNATINFSVQKIQTSPAPPSKYTISGTVNHITDSKPVSGFTMTLYKVSGSSSVQRGIATTLSDGHYAFPAGTLEPGDYKIKYEKSGYNGSTSGIFTITNQNLVRNFLVALSGTTPSPTKKYTVSGQVNHVTDNIPVSGFTLTLYKVSGSSMTQRGVATTLSNGTYSFPSGTLEPGDYKIVYEKSGYNGSTTGVLTITNQNIIHNFIVAKSGTTTTSKYTILGTFLEITSRKPVAGFNLTLYKVVNNSSVQRGTAVTLSDGTYAFPAGTLEPGDYKIKYEKSGYNGTTTAAIPITDKNIVHDFYVAQSGTSTTPATQIKNSVTGTIWLKKSDGNLTPLINQSGIKVTAINTSNQMKTASLNSSKGSYSLTELNNTNYNIVLSPISGLDFVSSDSQTVNFSTNVHAANIDFIVKQATSPSIVPISKVPPVSTIPTATGVQPKATPTGTKVTSSPTKVPTPTQGANMKQITGQIWIKNGSSKKKYTGGNMNITATNTSNQHKTVQISSNGSYQVPNLTQTQYTVSTTAPDNATLTTANNVKVAFTTTKIATADFTIASTVATSPTSSPTSIPTPTETQTTTPSVIPTETLVPTATPEPQGTRFAFTILMHGIGHSGDNANPTAFDLSNQNPIHQQRTLTVDVIDTQGTTVITKSGLINYQAADGNFTGIIDMGTTLTSGSYNIKIKVPQYLKKQIAGIQNVTPGQTITIPATTLVTGEINGDNTVNILDYDVIIGCYSDFAPAESCTGTQSIDADITDDGKVDQSDYNLFMRGLSVQNGD